MAAITYYGSKVLDATLVTASDMSQTTGGTEGSSRTTTTGGAGLIYAEICSQAQTLAGNTAIPATPTGKGWISGALPGAGSFANGNWSASVTLASSSNGGGAHANVTIRFFKYSGGVYTSIGTIVVAYTQNAKKTYSFAATSMPLTTFGASDLVYVDLWWFDNNANVGGDNPNVFLSTSATVGVANDMQVTTSVFTPTVSSVTSGSSNRRNGRVRGSDQPR
jgi:hypothetical protein